MVCCKTICWRQIRGCFFAPLTHPPRILLAALGLVAAVLERARAALPKLAPKQREIMKYCFVLLMLGVTAALSAGQSGASGGGPYLRVGLGAALTENTDAENFPGVGQTRLDLDAGLHLSVAGGVMFGDFFGLELETGCMVNEIDTISGFDEVDGYVAQLPFLVNAVVQLRNRTGLTPFIGAGAGGAASGIHLDNADSGSFQVEGSAGDVVFAWQLFGGLKLALGEHLSLGILYKYFGTGDAGWDLEDGSQDISFDGARSHSISAVVNFSF